MPIIITWDRGERQAFIGPTGDKLLDTRYPIVKRFESGHTEHLVKDKIRSIEDVTDEDWNKMVEGQKQGQEKQKADQEAAQKKALDDKAKADAECFEVFKKHAEANAEWRRKFFVVRLFSKRPFPEVA
jgi:hypothetical protein